MIFRWVNSKVSLIVFHIVKGLFERIFRLKPTGREKTSVLVGELACGKELGGCSCA